MQSPYTLTDTHTHFYYNVHTGKLQEQMQRCLDNNIHRLFLPNVDNESVSAVMDTVAAYPENCFPMLGLHPCSVKENYKEELALIENAITKHKIYAIGEIGIDLYWDKSTLAWQQDAFRAQVAWAKELGLPIDIHCREAFDETFELLIKMYKESDMVNAYFAAFNRFVAKWKDHPFIQKMISDELRTYVEYQLLPYEQAREAEINFIGSIAYYYSDLLQKVVEEYGLRFGAVIQKPIESLVDYHRKYIFPRLEGRKK